VTRVTGGVARKPRPANSLPGSPADRSGSLKSVTTETSLPQAADRLGGDRPFPIVGIGASAGGLEALEAFLTNVPVKSGMAFVVVQHLDPTHKGIMVELLQRATPMPVVQVGIG
jgi:chemotaxis response regulator CheB